MASSARNLSVVGETRGSAHRGSRNQSRRTGRSGRTGQIRQEYIYGDAVPAPEEPRRPDEAPRRRIRKRTSPQVRQNRKRALYMSPGYVLFLAAAAAIALIVCVNYVQLQSQITSSARNITVLQEELSDLEEANNTRYNNVTNSVNLEQVRERAEELGMTYAQADQIVEYSNPSSDYVEQYESIPQDGVIVR